MIACTIQESMKAFIGKGKVLTLLGPKHAGKTTLLKTVTEGNARFWNCDESHTRQRLTNTTTSTLQELVGTSKLIVIDEAQWIPDIGKTICLMHDQFPDVQLIVASSSLINIPLPDRAIDFQLFPFSTAELTAHTSELEESRLLEDRMLYGSYPEVVNDPGNERVILRKISSDVLYQNIRKPWVIEKLLQALALKVGEVVSYNELSSMVGVDILTVQRYVDLFEKHFVIFHLPSYSKNVRTELKKSVKIYFYDNGIRNSILNNFTPLALRSDTWALWENFLVSERLKKNAYVRNFARSYFWRTSQKQEIDYLEEKDGKLASWEFKYNPKKGNTRCPLTFSNNYPDTPFEVVTQENYLKFVR